ncbi:hypothetical protein KIPB_006153 [Kipferlia bialata]|uniref:Uncharacterized protein n=1 Tax=Kipferlia bialata TaxID=797122 RepID=A0A9K3CYA5_9EUKA|nr:hypothetical protein KIPB_006153 [Kipferlia bialata]|eukprot:g6153.t1
MAVFEAKELRKALRGEGDVSALFTAFVEEVSSSENLTKPEYQDEFILLLTEHPTILERVHDLSTSTMDALLHSLLVICNKNPSDISGEAMCCVSALVMSDGRAFRQLRPTSSTLLQLSLPMYILGEDARLKKAAVDLCLFLVLRHDDLNLSTITSDQRVIQNLAWAERKQSHERYKRLLACTEGVQAMVAEHTVRLKALSDSVGMRETESEEMEARHGVLEDQIIRHAQRLAVLAESAGTYTTSLESLHSKARDHSFHLRRLVRGSEASERGMEDLAGDVSKVSTAVTEAAAAIHGFEASVRADTDSALQAMRDELDAAVAGLSERTQGALTVVSETEATQQALSEVVSAMRSAEAEWADRVAAALDGVAADQQTALDSRDRVIALDAEVKATRQRVLDLEAQATPLHQTVQGIAATREELDRRFSASDADIASCVSSAETLSGLYDKAMASMHTDRVRVEESGRKISALEGRIRGLLSQVQTLRRDQTKTRHHMEGMGETLDAASIRLASLGSQVDGTSTSLQQLESSVVGVIERGTEQLGSAEKELAETRTILRNQSSLMLSEVVQAEMQKERSGLASVQGRPISAVSEASSHSPLSASVSATPMRARDFSALFKTSKAKQASPLLSVSKGGYQPKSPVAPKPASPTRASAPVYPESPHRRPHPLQDRKAEPKAKDAPGASAFPSATSEVSMSVSVPQWVLDNVQWVSEDKAVEALLPLLTPGHPGHGCMSPVEAEAACTQVRDSLGEVHAILEAAPSNVTLKGTRVASHLLACAALCLAMPANAHALWCQDPTLGQLLSIARVVLDQCQVVDRDLGDGRRTPVEIGLVLVLSACASCGAGADALLSSPQLVRDVCHAYLRVPILNLSPGDIEDRATDTCVGLCLYGGASLVDGLVTKRGVAKVTKVNGELARRVTAIMGFARSYCRLSPPPLPFALSLHLPTMACVFRVCRSLFHNDVRFVEGGVGRDLVNSVTGLIASVDKERQRDLQRGQRAGGAEPEAKAREAETLRGLKTAMASLDALRHLKVVRECIAAVGKL